MKNNNYFPLERNLYFYGKMLTARDFETEQRYFNNKRRLVNRTTVGAGVVCGLGVYQNDETSFFVETGMALDYHGREIVVASPVIRKLQMVEGYDKLSRSDQAYLCLRYNETPREPVNNIGAVDKESERFNKVEEDFSLYLSTDDPDVREIYANAGINHVTTVYSGAGLKIIRIIPKLALSNDELTVRFVVLKGIDSPAVSFKYSFHSDYFTEEDGNDKVTLSFTEDKNKKRDVYYLEYTLRTSHVTETSVHLSKGEGTLSVQMGDFTDKAVVADDPDIFLCEDQESYSIMKNTRMSTLESHSGGENTPIFLAKIDCMNIGTGFIIRHITPLPFEQRILPRGTESGRTAQTAAPAATGAPASAGKAENILRGGVTTEVETLDYWQKPQVNASYSPKNKSLSFRFGIPSTEAYDYATASGIIDIPVSGAIRVNSRFFSEEVPHNLGIGDVSISVSVEYNENDERRLLFGNGEIFAAKNDNKDVPRIESAALLYPEKGTFKVGIRMLDYVGGHSVRVRWFAYKPTRDTAKMRSQDAISIKITPDIHKLKPLERVRFAADVEGCEDRSVIWSVNDAAGGTIDTNGLYQAPSAAGTYEIVATSVADNNSKTSAFVIVED